jgi:hypothetical protein
MRIADLTSGAARLRDAADVLAAKWAETQEFWKDDNSRSLEENQLRPLAGELSSALTAIQRLAEVLDQAQRECESWDER